MGKPIMVSNRSIRSRSLAILLLGMRGWGFRGSGDQGFRSSGSDVQGSGSRFLFQVKGFKCAGFRVLGVLVQVFRVSGRVHVSIAILEEYSTMALVSDLSRTENIILLKTLLTDFLRGKSLG